MIMLNCEQGSPAWFEARLGIVTASNFGTVMAEGQDGGPSMTRTELLYRLAGERITGMPAEETFKSKAMLRGKEMEPQAVADYVEHTGYDVRRVGFVKNFSGLKECGASPDALVGFDGGLETKTMRPDLMIPLLLKGARMIPAHRAQVQGNIWVCERSWWDLKIFWPGMPNYTVKCLRDNNYIKELSNQVERFNFELDSLVKLLRKMGAK
jgi:hypothetical protein